MKGYKGFDKNFQCRGFQYEEGKEFIEDVEPSLCSAGLHFCEMPLDVLNYYDYNGSNIFAEVEAFGDIVEGEDKAATNKLKVLSKISFAGLFKAHFEIIKQTTIESKETKNTSGDYAHANTSGDEAIASSLGVKSRAKAVKGWIIITDWRYCSEQHKWKIENIHSSKVGGQIEGINIKPDTYYWFENGKLMEEKNEC